MKEPEWLNVQDKGDGSGRQKRPIYEMGWGLATVPDRLLEATIESAEECPGECIMIELIDE